MTTHRLRYALPALLAASALALSGCTSDKQAPGVPPGAQPTGTVVTPAPTTAPSVEPSKAAEAITKPVVKKGSDAVATYGEASVQAAQAAANDYAYTMTMPDIMLGKVKGQDRLDLFGNLMTKDLFEMVTKDKTLAEGYSWSPVPGYTPTKVRMLSLATTDVAPSTDFKGMPSLVSTVTAVAEIWVGKDRWVVERSTTIYLFQQADVEEGEWRVDAFNTAKDADVTAKYPATK